MDQGTLWTREAEKQQQLLEIRRERGELQLKEREEAQKLLLLNESFKQRVGAHGGFGQIPLACCNCLSSRTSNQSFYAGAQCSQANAVEFSASASGSVTHIKRPYRYCLDHRSSENHTTSRHQRIVTSDWA